MRCSVVFGVTLKLLMIVNISSSFPAVNVKNFHGSLTTVVRAQNDTPKTTNITDTIFDRKLVTGYTLTNDGVSC